MNGNNYEEIAPTAIITSYPRIFTDILYANEIYNWLNNHCYEEVILNKMLAPEIEARYKLINKLLNKSNIKQVFELAAGYSSRGLMYAKKGYNYLEMDLKKVSDNKIILLNSIEKKLPKNLNIISGNVLDVEDFNNYEKYLDINQNIVVINEGLLRYLTFSEKRMVAENIYKLLLKCGGIWITSDLTPKSFIKSQNIALKGFNDELTVITQRNNINDRFDDIEHVKEFFEEIGFELLEVHKFNEVKNELYSVNKLNIYNEKIEKTLEDAIVVVMKVKQI